MATITDYINNLKQDKSTLIANLRAKGITDIADTETFTELAPRVLFLSPHIYKTYTVVIDQTNSNPETSVTYEDDAVGMTPASTEWDDFFGYYPCLFKEGKEVGKLNPNNFAQFEDGSPADITTGNAGDVMIAFPRRGLKIETIENKVYISMTEEDNKEGFSYLAHTRGEERRDVFYLGAYKGSFINPKLRSLSGKAPYTFKNISQYRSYAQANGVGYEQSGWFQLIYRQAMYILKYKNLNSQTALGRGYVDGNSNAITTGGTDTKGMNYGEATGKEQMKLFGIEDFWGNVNEWIDGILTDGTRNLLTATTNFNSTGEGYKVNESGLSKNIGGYVKTVNGNQYTGFAIKEAGGSETTYFTDLQKINSGCVTCFGGNWNVGSQSGVFSLLIFLPNYIGNTMYGSRLMFL